MEAQSPSNYQAVTTGGFDAKSVIALSDSRKEIAEFILGLNGLRIVADGKNYKTVRYKKPLFTSEFTQDLLENVFIQINMVTMRSTFTDEQVRRYNEMYGEDLARYLSIHGIRHVVSETVWAKWLELTSDESFCEEKGINWRYDFDFKSDYMFLTKEHFKIHNESFGQVAILKMIWDAIMYFIHSGRNKSLNALSLNFEREIIRESHTSSDLHNKERREGRLMSFLNSLGGK